MWFWFALGSAVFAALTSILAKIGIEGVNSNLATAIRTVVVVVMAWGMVFLTNAQGGIKSISDSTSGWVVSTRTYASKLDAVAGNSILPDDTSVSASVTIVFELK